MKNRDISQVINKTSFETMLSILNNLLRTSLTGVSLEEQLQLFLEHIVSVALFEPKAKGSIFIVGDDPDVLVLKAQKGLAEPLLSACARVPFGRCLCGRAALSGEIQFADCVDDRHENRYEGMSGHGHYCVPILSAGKTMGVINLYVREGHTRDEIEEAFLRGISDVIAGIMQRNQVEEALRESEALYRLLAENLEDVIWTADMNLKFTYMSPSIYRFRGYTPEEAMALSVEETLTPESLEVAMRTFAEQMALENAGQRDLSKAVTLELEEKCKNGGKVWSEVKVALLRDSDGRLIGLLGTARDITERRKMEEQLQLAGRLAVVGELSAGVAHELNNPIAAIQGYAQLLTSQNDLDEKTRKDIEIIYREAQRAAKITQNLLYFARHHEPEKQFISLNEVIEKTLEVRAQQMKVNNIELVVELAPDLPKTMADFYQMQQVFMNIINNAEQAMVEAHGRGKLIVKTQKTDEMIWITFVDDGPGISEENLKKIFDPFFTTKEVGKGTGLGLSICYGLVEAHGGRIHAKSRLGEGATFVVEIPIVSQSPAGC